MEGKIFYEVRAVVGPINTNTMPLKQNMIVSQTQLCLICLERERSLLTSMKRSNQITTASIPEV
jgi:hypothetical protein